MPLRRFGDWFLGLFRRAPRQEEDPVRRRGPALHVVILDGTMSSLADRYETNAGKTYKLLREAGHTANLTLHYEAGIQWRDWRETYTVMTGKGINRQIRRAYGVLASRYREGDRIILIGYSRGAYAVRSLAGVIGKVGLLHPHEAIERNIRQAYRLYQLRSDPTTRAAFRSAYCHPEVRIDAIGVWETVKALGLRLPLLWRLTEEKHSIPRSPARAACRLRLSCAWDRRNPRGLSPRFVVLSRKTSMGGSSRSGSVARMMMSAARSGIFSPRARLPISRSSGFLNGSLIVAFHFPQAGKAVSRRIRSHHWSALGAAGGSCSCCASVGWWGGSHPSSSTHPPKITRAVQNCQFGHRPKRKKGPTGRNGLLSASLISASAQRAGASPARHLPAVCARRRASPLRRLSALELHPHASRALPWQN